MSQAFSIKGETSNLSEGETIRGVTERAGIGIPTLCHTKSLLTKAGYRLYLVQSNAHDRPIEACYTSYDSMGRMRSPSAASERVAPERYPSRP